MLSEAIYIVQGPYRVGDPNQIFDAIDRGLLSHVQQDLWLSMDDDAFDPMQREAEIIYFSCTEIRVY